jgi:hypothetical protein
MKPKPNPRVFVPISLLKGCVTCITNFALKKIRETRFHHKIWIFTSYSVCLEFNKPKILQKPPKLDDIFVIL